MNDETKNNLKNETTWKRALYMVLFLIISSVAKAVIGLVVVVQFFFVLLVGKANNRLLKFGNELSIYVYDILQYLTYNSEEKPFPFGEWKEKI